MADDDRRRAALGLRRLAGIVDDEGIDQRHRAQRDFRRAVLATAPPLLPGSHSSVPCAPQWISASMFSTLAQPEIEGEIAVARRESAIMIIGLASSPGRRDPAAARQDFPARRKRKRKAPSRTEQSLSGSPQAAFTRTQKSGGRPLKRRDSRPTSGVGRPNCDGCDQLPRRHAPRHSLRPRARENRRVLCVVSRPDRIADAATLAGIIRQDSAISSPWLLRRSRAHAARQRRRRILCASTGFVATGRIPVSRPCRCAPS